VKGDFSVTVLADRKKVATDLTTKIEAMLDGFGIKSRVEAVDFEKTYTQLRLSIAQGVRVEDVESLSKTIALHLASHTGKVEMIAPLPGTTYIGIRVPVKKTPKVSKP